MDLDPKREPTCPRCGYNLRGLIATWTDACPLESTCTECGLTFRCAEAILPEKFEPKWCVEFAPASVIVIAKSCPTTLAHSLLPWRFWQRMRMSYPIRPRRLVTYITTLLLPFLIIPIPMHIAAAMIVWNMVQTAIDAEVDEHRRSIARLRGMVSNHRVLRTLTPEQRLRYGEEFQRDIDAAVAVHQAAIDNPAVIKHAPLMAIVEALFTPLAPESSGHVLNRDGTTTAYPGPNEIWSRVLAARERPLQWWPVAWEFIPGLRTRQVLMIWSLAYLLFPLTFIMLPWSRARSKVKWSHIWRVAAYGSFIPIFAVFLATILLAFVWISPAAQSRTTAWHVLISTWMIPIGMVIWWAFAIGRYMKIRHAWWIALIQTYVALLAVLVCAYLIASRLLFDVMWL